MEQNRIEEPPEELRGRELNVEYISVLAKQQMASAEQGIGNFIQSLGMISQINPSALDKLDVDKAIDHIADYEACRRTWFFLQIAWQSFGRRARNRLRNSRRWLRRSRRLRP